MPQLPRAGWEMELLDLQQHKTTIYITAGFTAGFMILLTCLSKKQRCLKPRHCKNTLHPVGFSEEWALIKVKSIYIYCNNLYQPVLALYIFFWIICWGECDLNAFIISFILTKIHLSVFSMSVIIPRPPSWLHYGSFSWPEAFMRCLWQRWDGTVSKQVFKRSSWGALFFHFTTFPVGSIVIYAPL